MAILEFVRPFALLIGIVNMGLLLSLLLIYFKSYRSIRSKFTLGLIIFATLMLLHKIGNILFIFRYNEFGVPRLGLPAFILLLIEFFAYSALLWISWD